MRAGVRGRYGWLCVLLAILWLAGSCTPTPAESVGTDDPTAAVTTSGTRTEAAVSSGGSTTTDGGPPTGSVPGTMVTSAAVSVRTTGKAGIAPTKAPTKAPGNPPTKAPTKAPAKPTAAPQYTGPINIRTPQASGTVVYSGSGAVIDASHAADGYVMVKYTGDIPKLKVRLMTPGRTYDYDLIKRGDYEVYPLQAGNGEYRVRVMENLTGNQYAELFAATIQVRLKDEFTPFLYPNQYVSYTAASNAVKTSFDLCVGAKTDLQKIQAIYAYIVGTIRYDEQKAQTVKSGYLPDVDAVLRSKKGICFDYATLLCAMLRAQGLPVKLIIGTVAPGDLSHAWNLVYTKEKGWIPIGLYFSGGVWKLMDATFAASMGGDMDKYIGNGSQYTGLRVY